MLGGINNVLEVRDGQFGRGVFSRVNLTAGQVLEIVPIILIPKGNAKVDSEYRTSFSYPRQVPTVVHQLSRYTFSWTNELDAIALGFGSIYNHNREHTVDYIPHVLDQSMSYVSRVDIAAGQELFINYAYEPRSFPMHHTVEQQITEVFNREAPRFDKFVNENVKRYQEREAEKKLKIE